MRRLFACALGALVAVSFCAATVTAASVLGMQPRYPAYAGEEDFSLRVEWFILLELPGFALLGGGLGHVAAGRVRRGVLGAAGMIAGTVIAFLVQSALRPTIESLPHSNSANLAVVVFLIAWLVLAGVGAVLGVLRAGEPTGGAKFDLWRSRTRAGRPNTFAESSGSDGVSKNDSHPPFAAGGRRLVVTAIAVAVVAGGLGFVFDRAGTGGGPATGGGDCRRTLESAAGKYAHLAVVDDEGYVLPFSGLNLGDGAVWEVEINDERSGVRRVRDRSFIKRLQSQRFECTGTDMATPDMGLSVYRDGVLVYRTDFVKGEGLQNPELGFARAKNRLRFGWLLR